MPHLINVYSTVREVPPKNFPHTLNSERDRSAPEMADHLNGFCNFVVSRGDGKMNQLKFHLIQHIQRTRYQGSFTIQDHELDAFSGWAVAVNGLLFIGQGFIVDPRGKILLPPGGGAGDEGAQVPYPADAVARKARHMEDFARRGWKVLSSLPPVLGEAEVVTKSPQEVALRSIALMMAAVQAESMSQEKGSMAAEFKERYPWAWQALTPAEFAFMTNAAPAEQEMLNFSWRYEALNVLAWAMGIQPALPFPDAVCEVAGLVRALSSAAERLREDPPQLRPVAELLDQLDFHFRLHWMARQARLDRQEPPGGLDSSVIQERHHALNWLLGFGNFDVAWDDIDTPT